MKFDTTYLHECAHNQHKGRLKERIKANFEYTFLLLLEALANGYTASARYYEEKCITIATTMHFTDILTDKEHQELFECLNCVSIDLAF